MYSSYARMFPSHLLRPLLLLLGIAMAAAAVAIPSDSAGYTGTLTTTFTFSDFSLSLPACSAQTSRSTSSKAMLEIHQRQETLSLTTDGLNFSASISLSAPLSSSPSSTTSPSSSSPSSTIIITDAKLLSNPLRLDPASSASPSPQLLPFVAGLLVPSNSATLADPCSYPPIQKIISFDTDPVLSRRSNTSPPASPSSNSAQANINFIVIAAIALPEGMSTTIRVSVTLAFDGSVVSSGDGASTRPTDSRATPSTTMKTSTARSTSETGTITAQASSRSASGTMTSSWAFPTTTSTASVGVGAGIAEQGGKSGVKKTTLPAGSVVAMTISIATVLTLLVAAIVLLIRRRSRRRRELERQIPKIVYPEVAYLYDPQRAVSPSAGSSAVSSVLELGGIKATTRDSPREQQGQARPMVPRVHVTRPGAVQKRMVLDAVRDTQWSMLDRSQEASLRQGQSNGNVRRWDGGTSVAPPIPARGLASTVHTRQEINRHTRRLAGDFAISPVDVRRAWTGQVEELVVRDGQAGGVAVTRERLRFF